MIEEVNFLMALSCQVQCERGHVIFSVTIYTVTAYKDFKRKDLYTVLLSPITRFTSSMSVSGIQMSFFSTYSRVVTKISSCRVNTTSRRGIKRLGISFGSIFLLFSNKSSRGPLSQQSGKIPGLRLLMTTLNEHAYFPLLAMLFITPITRIEDMVTQD